VLIFGSELRAFHQLRMFAREVTRVALEVGTHGILGGQAQVEGVEGTWMHLTDNVNVRSPSINIHFQLTSYSVWPQT